MRRTEARWTSSIALQPSNKRLDADGRSNGERPRDGWRRRDR